MAPLPSRRGLIDYALSDIRSPEMDCFLLSHCRYLLGTNSGPMAVATSFGVVCGITNYIPIAFPVCSPRNLMLPKMIFSRKVSRYLTVDEMMAPPLGFSNRSHIYKRFGRLFDAELIENTPEEILAFTQDLHSWAQSSFISDDPRHKTIHEIMQRRDGIYVSPFAKSWLDRYEAYGCLDTSPSKLSFENAWRK
jgi:putative glycosyltransferase (TIGR04372 family)